MAVINPVNPAPDGTAITMAAAASGDTAQCGRGRILLVQNGGGSPITATITVPGTTPTGEAVPDNPITVAAGALVAIPLLDLYRDPATRQAAITWSATASVTRAVIAT